jgi:hypothetical protein
MAAGLAPGDLRIFAAYLLPHPDLVFPISLGFVQYEHAAYDNHGG